MSDLEDKVVLITGGTGSFGHELLRNIRWDNCREIRIFSRDELKQELMRTELNDPKIKFYLGDVRERASVDRAMKGVHLAFHAAALKQVPSCEFFPMEAVATNVTGSHNVIQSAIQHGVRNVVCLSTDKAVYPINTMGMTKALMEKVAQAAARDAQNSGTTISCVRYGNVMYSRGSVIPLFVRQLTSGMPLTVTEPGMTRFLLPLKEAIALVLFAFSHARQGDIFVKKSPACTMADLAAALNNVFGARAPIKRIGIRHGEKIYETLVNREELSTAEDMGDYFRLKMDGRDLNYGRYLTEGNTRESLVEDYTSHTTRRLTQQEVEALLLTLPEIAAELEAYRRAAS